MPVAAPPLRARVGIGLAKVGKVVARRAAGFLLALLLCTQATVAAPEVSLDILPRLGLAPLTVRWRARVPNASQNRLLVIVLEGPGDYRRADIDLSGDGQVIPPAVFERMWEVRTGGPVTWTATLLRADGSTKQVSWEACYASRSQECP